MSGPEQDCLSVVRETFKYVMEPYLRLCAWSVSGGDQSFLRLTLRIAYAAGRRSESASPILFTPDKCAGASLWAIPSCCYRITAIMERRSDLAISPGCILWQQSSVSAACSRLAKGRNCTWEYLHVSFLWTKFELLKLRSMPRTRTRIRSAPYGISNGQASCNWSLMKRAKFRDSPWSNGKNAVVLQNGRHYVTKCTGNLSESK